MNQPRPEPRRPRAPTRVTDGFVRRSRAVVVASVSAFTIACGQGRPGVIGPAPDAAATARGLERGTELDQPVRIDFDWELNESGSRLSGRGVARIEPPYRARLDLFLEGGEGVVSAALVDQDLRLPYGSRDDILPPVDLMWGTLGVFRPVANAELVAGERLEGGAERLKYRQRDGTELHYETAAGSLQAVELLEGNTVVQWVRISGTDDTRYPRQATYRNLYAFRELKITRSALRNTEPFDPAIWNPR